MELAARVMAASATLGAIFEDPHQTKIPQSLTADAGCFGMDEICCRQEEKVRIISGNPHSAPRNPGKLNPVIPAVLNKARPAVRSESSKVL